MHEPSRLNLKRLGRQFVRPYKQARSALKLGLRRVPHLGPRLDRRWFERRFSAMHDTPLRLDPPTGFNARIIHRILFERDPMLRLVCDKIAVRDLVRDRLGEDFVVPLLGVWDSADRIAWDALPARFVLKPNHASGVVAIVQDKAACDRTALTADARDWLRLDYFALSREWGYRDIPRRLMAEQLLVGPDGAEAPEATVMTFGGKAAAIRILTGAKGTPDRHDNWFDATGARLPIHSAKLTPGDYVLAPAMARTLVDAAAAVAGGFDHIRVDFYLTPEGLRIGELTPYHGAGLTVWNDQGCDHLFGQLWRDPSSIDRIRELAAAYLRSDPKAGPTAS